MSNNSDNLPDFNSMGDVPVYGRRSFMSVKDWKKVKRAIDAARSDPEDYAAQEVLIDYGLWNLEEECINEDHINFLYTRNA